MEKNEVLDFESITHLFADTSKQVENGIFTLRKFANFVKKLCAAKESYAKKVFEVSGDISSSKGTVLDEVGLQKNLPIS